MLMNSLIVNLLGEDYYSVTRILLSKNGKDKESITSRIARATYANISSLRLIKSKEKVFLLIQLDQESQIIQIHHKVYIHRVSRTIQEYGILWSISVYETETPTLFLGFARNHYSISHTENLYRALSTSKSEEMRGFGKHTHHVAVILFLSRSTKVSFYFPWHVCMGSELFQGTNKERKVAIRRKYLIEQVWIQILIIKSGQRSQTLNISTQILKQGTLTHSDKHGSLTDSLQLLHIRFVKFCRQPRKNMKIK